MSVSRRDLMRASLAAGATVALPGAAQAQTSGPEVRTLRVVMAGDLRVFDPIWTTANITSYHASMVYDTLFSADANFKAQPQMVGKWDVSDDKKTYTFELRDGLGWHDGTPVTAADCVASIRRWGEVDPGGQAILARASDISKKDDKTFVIALKQPFGLLLDELAKPVPRCCFVMREKDARKPATEQVSENIGSGPFIFNQRVAKPGASYTYDRNPSTCPAANRPRASLAARLPRLIR